MDKIKGIIPALVTPFNDNNELAVEEVPKLVEMLIEARVAGLFVCGATGEAPMLSIDERTKMAEVVIKTVNKRIPVIIHVGATYVETACKLAKHAEVTGASAASTLPPLDKTLGIDAVIEYYRQVGGASKLPFYVYWKADMAISGVTPEIFLEKMKVVPNFFGIKFTDTNFYFFQRLIAISGGKLNCLTGPDEMFISGLAMGSDGAVGSNYNIMPRHFVSIYNDFTAGRITEAREKQYQANEFVSLILKFGVNPSIKAVLERRGFKVGLTRPNNNLTLSRNLSEDEVDQLMAVMEKYNLS